MKTIFLGALEVDNKGSVIRPAMHSPESAIGKRATLAMHLWPERIIPKCSTGRSLAIANRGDDVFWTKADDGKWTPRPTPTRSVDELVRERTSFAFKAALKGLAEASLSNGPNARTRRSLS
jgi:hypothetical protein